MPNPAAIQAMAVGYNAALPLDVLLYADLSTQAALRVPLLLVVHEDLRSTTHPGESQTTDMIDNTRL